MLSKDTEGDTPYIEVQIESKKDHDKIEMNYELEFIDDTTIQLLIFFKSAQYISAEKPEDVLKISFWGPFFSKEDGEPLD